MNVLQLMNDEFDICLHNTSNCTCDQKARQIIAPMVQLGAFLTRNIRVPGSNSVRIIGVQIVFP